MIQPLKSTRNIFCRLHRDQRGSISIATVFSFLLLTMLLGMVMNIGRHADRKIKIQNAADAATFTGGAVVARSMNTLTFTNYLLCDVFALTAYLREARDRNAESLIDPILDQWEKTAPEFEDAPLTKFSELAAGIPSKIPLEKQLIKAFGDQNAAISEQMLPVVEEILGNEMIPQFQRALVEATPQFANEAANEIASRHGPLNVGLAGGYEPMHALMWRTDALEFGSETSSGLSQMPVADPLYDTTEYQSYYFQKNVKKRNYMAYRFLRQLNHEMLLPLDANLRQARWDNLVPPDRKVFRNAWGPYGYHNGAAKMSQFGNMWRGFTKAHLKQLLEVEHAYSNIPYAMRVDPLERTDQNAYLEKDFMFVGVTYWSPMEERMPGLFRNPLNADSVAFAQTQLFIPVGRFIQDLKYLGERGEYRFWSGPANRDLWNQNWTVQLVPGTSQSIPTIIQSVPTGENVTTPNLGGLSVDQFRRLNTH